jgi:hypothetical protein
MKYSLYIDESGDHVLKAKFRHYNTAAKAYPLKNDKYGEHKLLNAGGEQTFYKFACQSFCG